MRSAVSALPRCRVGAIRRILSGRRVCLDILPTSRSDYVSDLLDREEETFMTDTKTVVGHSIADREQALDFMAGYPGYGEQRWYSDALGTEQVSFSWRRMPPGTGGRGSYGHRHPRLPEGYLVVSRAGTVQGRGHILQARP